MKEQREEFTKQIEAPAEVELVMAQAKAMRPPVSDVQSFEGTSEKMHAQHKEIVNV